MANTSLQDHKLFIIRLYRQNYAEEEIAEQLRDLGIETTFSEVQHHLETWRIIPCPSPVHSQETDTQSDRPRQAPRHKLGVTCHHGETSHISEINVADIVSGSTPVEKYQQDKQSHEELALKFQLSEEERMKRREPLVDDSILEVKSRDDGELMKEYKQMKNNLQRMGPSTTRPRLARVKRVRKRRDGIRK